MKLALLAITLFLAAAGLLWLPFDSYTVLYGTHPDGAIPAGDIASDFRLTQRVRPAVTGEAAPGGDVRQHCFAIRFATYARRNRGSFRVYWRQEGNEQQWLVAAEDLIDNSYRQFCPRSAFSAYRPFLVQIHGIAGKPGEAPTLWLVDDASFGRARIFPREHPQGKSMALQGSIRQHVGPGEIVRIDRGAWLLAWLCTLVIAITALISGFRSARNADDA